MRGRAVQAVRAHGIATRGGMTMFEGRAFGARLIRGVQVHGERRARLLSVILDALL